MKKYFNFNIIGINLKVKLVYKDSSTIKIQRIRTFKRDFVLPFLVYLIALLPKFLNFMIKKMCKLGEIKDVTLVGSTILKSYCNMISF
jgi:hypothetical protein